MKRFLLSVLAGCAAAGSLCAQTSVWKVTKGNSTLYLGGTCHVLRASDLPLPPEFDAAYRAATVVYFETDLARAQSPEMQQIVMTRGIFTDGTTIDQIVSPATWAELSRYCEKRQIPLPQFRNMKPWLLAVMIAAIELQKLGVSQEGADMIYLGRVRADGKKLGQLETFERQVDYLTGMAGDKPDEFLRNAVSDLDKIETEFTQLLGAWRKGDLAAIDGFMNRELREKYPELHRRLIVERNNAWLPVVEKLLATPETEFVLAGVGHMAGPEGLVAQLRAHGCKVEQVTAPKSGK